MGDYGMKENFELVWIPDSVRILQMAIFARYLFYVHPTSFAYQIRTGAWQRRAFPTFSVTDLESLRSTSFEDTTSLKHKICEMTDRNWWSFINRTFFGRAWRWHHTYGTWIDWTIQRWGRITKLLLSSQKIRLPVWEHPYILLPASPFTIPLNKAKHNQRKCGAIIGDDGLLFRIREGKGYRRPWLDPLRCE